MRVEVVQTDQQLKDAYTVRSKVFIDEQRVPEEEEIDQFESVAVHFVVYDNDDPIGAGRLRFVENAGKVERVCVLKSHRGSGIGRILMNEMESVATSKGAKQLILHAQTHAEHFYSTLGYNTYSDVFMDAGIPHVAMKKII